MQLRYCESLAFGAWCRWPGLNRSERSFAFAASPSSGPTPMIRRSTLRKRMGFERRGSKAEVAEPEKRRQVCVDQTLQKEQTRRGADPASPRQHDDDEPR